jgi:ketosteroid isomerase-like protein
MPRSPRSKATATLFGGSADEVEAAFYQALHEGDVDKLMACWSDDDEVTCVHPGAARVVGVGAIRSAFDALFSNGGTVRLTPVQVRRVESLASAVHNVLERIDVMVQGQPQQAWVIATNVYHRTSQGWRMVLHHASPGSATEPPEFNQAPTVLH